MKAFCDYNEYEIAGEYDDAGKSGKSIEGRVSFNQMRDDIKSGKDEVSYVLVFKLYRFGRNAADVFATLQVMQDFGVNLICVEDGIDLRREYIKFDDFGPCPFMNEGDVFITGGVLGNECPEGFCPMAWQAICIQASTLAGGGKVYGVDDVHIACCNDGVRPVGFKLEMIEDGENRKQAMRIWLYLQLW